VLELHTSEPNTFFLKPLIALAEKGAAFTTKYFDANDFEQFGTGFPDGLEARLQLEREGPLLVHDGSVISSTSFMLEYISDSLPGPPLMPHDPFDAYRTRAWAQYLGAHLGSIVPVLGCAKYLQPLLASRDAADVDRQIAAIEPLERRAGWLALRNGGYTELHLAGVRERLAAPLARIEQALGVGPWLAGGFGAADIDAYPMLRVLPDLAPDAVNSRVTPRITEFLGRMSERDSVREALRTARTPHPERQFVPGVEAARWG
jgi:glutathione S-transferase/GST-like protein